MNKTLFETIVKGNKIELANLVNQYSQKRQDFDNACKTRNVEKIREILVETFQKAPESGEVHLNPGWSVLASLQKKF
jgi:hypothetical protein